MKSCDVRSGVRGPLPSISDGNGLLEDVRRRPSAGAEGFPHLRVSRYALRIVYRTHYLQRVIIAPGVSGAALTYEFADSGDPPSRPLPGGGHYTLPRRRR